MEKANNTKLLMQARFLEKAIDELALALFDSDTTDTTLTKQAEETARLVGCREIELLPHLRESIRTIASQPQRSNYFGTPEPDMRKARKTLTESRRQSVSSRLLKCAKLNADNPNYPRYRTAING